MSEVGSVGGAGLVGGAVERAFREEWGQVVATLIGMTGDWDLAEECAQEAFAEAVRTWGRDGVPRNPGGWLTTTARNRAVDRLRRAAVGETRLREAAALAFGVGFGGLGHDGAWHDRAGRDGAGRDGAWHGGLGDDGSGHDGAVPDDRLRLIFTCCHPALSFEARVALTLRTLTGLSTAEIARAFLVPEETMAKRLTRAKKKIREARIPYRVPSAEALPGRTSAVLGVLYLLFNEGYSDPRRAELAAEAIRLGRVLVRLMPGAAEPAGLLALLLLQDSRRDARLDVNGDLVTLDDQDRSLWDREEIAEGVGLLEGALAAGRPGPYQIQAALAACHATAARARDTDWEEIAALYLVLERYAPSAVVRLNRAVAVGRSRGPAAGLALVERLADELKGYHLLPAVRADLLTRLGRAEEARAAYREAISLAGTDTERRHLGAKLEEISLLVSCEGVALRRWGEGTTERGTKAMNTTVSADGTTIAYDRLGEGEPIILVSGASCARGVHAHAAELLSAGHTVYNYDRRGRGDSTDTAPFAVEREIEDLAAMIAVAGGTASVFGSSSGAILGLRAAIAGLPITKLVMWEPPFNLAPDAPRMQAEYVAELTAALLRDDRGAAQEAFMRRVGLPAEMIAGARHSPMWKSLEEIAHTLPYDAAAMGDCSVPEGTAELPVPVLVAYGTASGEWSRTAAEAVPGAQVAALEGQNHNVDFTILAPVITDFLRA